MDESRIGAIRLPEGDYIYVEVGAADETPIRGTLTKRPADLPEGAEPTGAMGAAADAIKSLRRNVEAMARTVHEGLASFQPDEWTLKLSIGFKGTVNPIPVIVKGEAEAGLKVTAKWKKAEPARS